MPRSAITGLNVSNAANGSRGPPTPRTFINTHYNPMTNSDTDNLRVLLAKKLWTDVHWYDGDNSGPGFWSGIPPAKLGLDASGEWTAVKEKWPKPLPDLASLVAEAERGLTYEQRRAYSRALYKEVTGTPWDSEIMRIGPLFACLLITAAPEARAAALLEILP